MENKKQKTALVTGAAGFIGFHISKCLIDEGWRVVGLDCMSSYYDVSLKVQRESILLESASYRSIHEKVETSNVLMNLFQEELPDVVIHLAAQAGVRYSIENPRAYLESNIIGTFELLEAARAYPPKHMMIASTSSAYGDNQNMPFKETVKADKQVSFYAATKKSTENMAHSYAHLFDLPITMFRLFTVYGPWGRPDMALFKFTKAILCGDPIDVYNYGNMRRDFTYIDDIIHGLHQLMNLIPVANRPIKKSSKIIDDNSFHAPFRVVNIGNSKPERLTDCIEEIERCVGVEAVKNFMPIQAGDVTSTWADISYFENLTKYKPQTNLKHGVQKFVSWYRSYYNV